MKKIILFIVILAYTIPLIGQNENAGFSYQAVIRSDDGNAVADSEMKITVDLFQKGVEASLYSEEHIVTTDKFGQLNMIIGQGELLSGRFSAIPWESGAIYYKVRLENEDNNLDLLSEARILAVPYAYYALKSGTVSDNSIGRSDGQYWSVDGNFIKGDNYKLGSLNDEDVYIVTSDEPRITVEAEGVVNVHSPAEFDERVNANSTLHVEGDATFGETLTVDWEIQGKKNLHIFGRTYLEGEVEINDNTTINGEATVHRDFTVGSKAPSLFTGDVEIQGELILRSNLTVDGTSDFGDTLRVNNMAPTLLSGKLVVDKETNLNDALFVNNMAKTTLSGELQVDKATNLNDVLNVNNMAKTTLSGELEVDKATNLNDVLNVNNMAKTSLTGELEVNKKTDLNAELNVNNAAKTTLTGALQVDQVTDLNNALNVNNMSKSTLSGDLLVLKDTDINGDLQVNSKTNLNGNLTVSNNANSYFDGKVDINGATNITNTLGVTGATTLKSTLRTEGQVTIDAALGGPDTDYNAYPLRIEGSSQGIAVKVTSVLPGGSSNFVSFFASNNSVIGRIEGQTIVDKATEPEFIFETGVLVGEEVVAIANQVLSFLPNGCAGVGAVACPPEPSVVAIAAADLILATASIVAYEIFAFSQLGVTYQSGSADYAEWLEREDSDMTLEAGEIVGVKGGKISKNTSEANQLLVISTNPAVLGNMKSEFQQENYEMVAFMGQVPVKVYGKVNIGDYIIPSGQNDGIGKAVSPNDITAEEYARIVGISWTETILTAGISKVNMAIGLNSNDVAELVAEQQNELELLSARFDDLNNRLLALENGESYIPVIESATASDDIVINEPIYSRREIAEQIIPVEFNVEGTDRALVQRIRLLEENGVDVNSNIVLANLRDNKAARIKAIQELNTKYKSQRPSIVDTYVNSEE